MSSENRRRFKSLFHHDSRQAPLLKIESQQTSQVVITSGRREGRLHLKPDLQNKVSQMYWTKGGALRKVPIGGGCRKKKTRSASSSRDLSSLFTGLSPPAMDFQLNGLNQFSLASLFTGIGGETEQQNQIVLDSQAQKLQPIMFQNLETSKSSQTEWFFDGNYAQVNVDQSHGKNVGNYENGNMNNWNNEIQGWNDFNDQYSALP
ncbi:DOF zinc finger protein DOF5.7-like protein [Tanacetum coccineum]